MKHLLSGLLLAAMAHTSVCWAQAPATGAVTGLWAGSTTYQNQEVHLLLRVKVDGADLLAQRAPGTAGARRPLTWFEKRSILRAEPAAARGEFRRSGSPIPCNRPPVGTLGLDT
jgi:hypothetical protein